MIKGIEFKKMNGQDLKIGVVVARWNEKICQPLFLSCKTALLNSGVREENIIVQKVPGTYEVVFGAAQIIKKYQVDAVVCLGALIKGETMHFEYIAEAVSQGIMNLSFRSDTPVIFGVLTCLTEAQAVARSSGENNHGYNWGLSAVEMALINK